MGLVTKLPGRLVYAARPDRCWATGVLSNLGVLFTEPALPKARWAVGTRWRRARPNRFPPVVAAGHFAAFGAFTYANQLGLTLHYDPRAIEPVQAEDLIDAFVEQLRSSGGEGEH